MDKPVGVNNKNAREPLLERWVFGYRPVILVAFALLTLFLAYRAIALRPDASFLKMIPVHHPYIANFLKHKEDLQGMGNAVTIAVESTRGDIFSAEYMAALQKINDEVFYVPGVDRGALKSLWTPQTRWTDVTEEGFEGGPVVPDTYDGSRAALAQLRINVLKSGEVGLLVANNFKSSVVKAPLQDTDPETGERLNYRDLSGKLEDIREKYQSDTLRIHITGFAKVAGDLIDGATQVSLFFGMTILITLGMLFGYFRRPRCALMPLFCSIVGVVWQLGMLQVLNFGIDPYSMLVPFLVFAIGVSHGVQIVNAIQTEVMTGVGKRDAARLAFRGLYIPGITALVTDGIGFATLMVIRIEVIRDLAMGACLGVAVLVLTNLVLLPILMSYVGVGRKAVAPRRRAGGNRHPMWLFIARFADMPGAAGVLICLVPLFAWGVSAGGEVKIGDLDKGAPELRPDSRYNRDVAFMAENFMASSDVFVVMLETPDGGNSDYGTLVALDQFHALMKKTDGVRSVVSYLDIVKLLNGAFNEGNVKWMALSRSQVTLDNLTIKVPASLCNKRGSLSPVLVFLEDHRAETLERVVKTVRDFSLKNDTEKGRFLMAAGNAGIEAATNIVIRDAQYRMLIWVYGVVIILCLLMFRSVRVTFCIILPLVLTSIMCRVLMGRLGIGVKAATLPVIALGVGIGVDYGIYIYSRFRSFLARGDSPFDAYHRTLETTGKAVAFTGLTLACGVGTWVFSPIKFQADMGILLTFMFLVNMAGAIVILPALYRLSLFIGQPVGRKRKAPAEALKI